MPKRTNDFQQLITMIYSKIAPEATCVTESAQLLDKDTGTLREIDILLEHRTAHIDMKVMIECRDYARKNTVAWIDELIGKAKSLPVNKVIAVSKNGFTKIALKKAKENGIDALSLDDALETDWADFPFRPGVALMTNDDFKIRDVQYFNGTEFRSLGELDADSKVTWNGEEVGSISETYIRIFQEYLLPKFFEKVNKEKKSLFKTRADCEKVLVAEWEYPFPSHKIKCSDGTCINNVKRIKFIIVGTRKVKDIELKHQKLDGLMISTGEYVHTDGTSFGAEIVQDPETRKLHGSLKWPKK